MRNRQGLAIAVVVASVSAFQLAASGYDSIADLQVCDSQGQGTHPKLAQMPPEGRVRVRGVVLNATAELCADPNQYYFYVEDATGGGLQVYANRYYRGMAPFPQEYIDDAPSAGDVVEVTGVIAFYGGKTNINERHSADPSLNFGITILSTGNPMPEPTLIPNVTSCIFFDQTRTTGGELYQGRWCRIRNLFRVSGTWDAGQELVVTDGSGDLTVKLSDAGDFDAADWPAEPFDLTGIFDQEDPGEAPYTEGYRLWLKSMADVGTAQTASAGGWEVY